jgi:hypothetical protein
LTPERRDLIVRLLETRDDHLPEPVRRVEGMASGFVHRTLAPVVCPVCEGVESFGCAGCGGRGEVERPRDRDPYSVSTETKAYGLDGSRHDAAHERDRKIEMLGRQLRPPLKEAELLEEANHHGFGWEIARQRMYADFDYRALDFALDELRLSDELAYSMLSKVYIYGWLTHITPAVESICDRGIVFISDRLPERLRAPGGEKPNANTIARGRHADDRALAQRNGVIRKLHREGASIDDLKVRFGLKKSALYEIVNGAAA